MLPIAVLAGGFATRLGSLTRDLPKCLIQVNGKPFVDWQIELLRNSGYSDFVFCISYKSDQIQDHLGDGSKWGIKIEYSLDGETQLGTGGAIKNCLNKLGESFAVIYGDSYLPIDYGQVEEAFKHSTKSALMTVFENQNSLDASNVEYTNGKLIEYAKGSSNPRMRHIDYGLSYFHSSVFDAFPSDNAFDLADLVTGLSKIGKLGGFEVLNRFYEIGSISGIEDLSNYLGKALA